MTAVSVDFSSKEVVIKAQLDVGSESLRHAIHAVDLTYVPELIESSIDMGPDKEKTSI